VLVEGLLNIHCARRGHKLDNITADDRVCYSVVTNAEVVPSELSTIFESAIIFGRAAIVDDDEEKSIALNALVERLAPERAAEDAQVMPSFARTTVLRITPEHITGKAHPKK